MTLNHPRTETLPKMVYFIARFEKKNTMQFLSFGFEGRRDIVGAFVCLSVLPFVRLSI